MKIPLVSIVVPVYNVEKYLFQCLDSIVNQTYTNLEIIVVNDGSPDNSHLIVEEFSKNDSRIKIINQENAGLSAARNTGIKEATGEYLMFVDSDDWVDVAIVEKLLSKIDGVELVVCSYYRSYENTVIPRFFDMEGIIKGEVFQRRLVGLIGNELNDPSQADSLVTIWGKLYKLSIVKQKELNFVSTKEIGTCEDLIFNIQYVDYIENVIVLNLPLYYYRKSNNTSFTSHYKSNLFFQWKNLFKQIKRLICLNNEVFNSALNNRIALSIIGLGLNEMQNPEGFFSRYKKLRLILNDELYKKAYISLELKYFPMHWRLFFGFAKYRFVPGVYGMLLGINYFVNRNK
jgi:glycosyltransferase EpsH